MSAGAAPGLGDLDVEALASLPVDTVVSASKYQQRTTDAPSSVTIVPRSEIRAYGWRTMAELLRAVRGQSISYDHTYSYLGTRGFQRGGDYNARTLILINGHRTNDNIYDGVELNQGFGVDLPLVERVEVVRGPTSSVHGSNAFFGVVNIITRRGRDFAPAEGTGAGGEVYTEVGSGETWLAGAIAGGRTESGLEFLITARRYRSEGERDWFFPALVSAASDGFARHVDEERADNLFASASWGDFTLEGWWVQREKQIPTGSFGTIPGDPRTAGQDGQSTVRLAWDRALSPELRLHAEASHFTYRYDGRYAFRGDDLGLPVDSAVINDTADGRSLAAEVQATHVFAHRHVALLGVDFQRHYHQRQANTIEEPATPNSDIRSDSSNVSPYASLEFVASRAVTLSAGVRVDHYDTFGDSVHPRFAAIWQPHDHTTIKLLYGTAFRAPNAYERSYNDGGRTYRINPDLGPEEIATTECVLEQELPGGARGTISIFHYRLRDLISVSADPGTEVQFFDNVDRAQAHGFEAELSVPLPGGFTTRGSFTLHEAEDEFTGERLTYAPRSQGRLHLTAPLPGRTFFFGLEALYTGRRLTRTGAPMEDFWLANATLFTREFASGWSADASVYNVFDESYSDPASADHAQETLPQDRRTFALRARWRF